jgi:hypothetical protein
MSNSVVQQALDAAWFDSQPTDPVARHEEGGRIYMNTITWEITIKRAIPGITAAIIDLDFPPMVPGPVVVGVFHTHPNPTAEGWDPGPSPSDLLIDSINGVPDLIRADNGVHLSGRDSRRSGLIGGPGYPP